MDEFEGEQFVTSTWSEAKTIATGSLFVNVDLNDLLDRHPEAKVFELLGKLKDLLA